MPAERGFHVLDRRLVVWDDKGRGAIRERTIVVADAPPGAPGGPDR